MKNLDSVLSALLAFALLLSLCACGKKTETKAGTTPSNSTSATATGILPVSLSWTAGGPDNGEVKSTTTYSLDPGTKTLTVTDDHSGVLEPGEILLGLAGDSTLPEHPLLLTQMAYTSPQYRSSVFQSCLYLLFAENDLIRSGAITTLQLNQTNADPEEEHQDTYTFQAKGGKLLSYTHKSTSDTSTDYAPNSTATSEGTVTYQYDGTAFSPPRRRATPDATSRKTPSRITQTGPSKASRCLPGMRWATGKTSSPRPGNTEKSPR